MAFLVDDLAAAVDIGLFIAPLGVGLLMTLRFADISVGQHARPCLPCLPALLVGLMLITRVSEFSLFLPRSAGLIR